LDSAAELSALAFLQKHKCDAERAKLILSAQLGGGREYATIMRLVYIHEGRDPENWIPPADEATTVSATAQSSSSSSSAPAPASTSAAAASSSSTTTSRSNASSSSMGTSTVGKVKEKAKEIDMDNPRTNGGDGLIDRGEFDESGLSGTLLNLGLDIAFKSEFGEPSTIAKLCSPETASTGPDLQTKLSFFPPALPSLSSPWIDANSEDPPRQKMWESWASDTNNALTARATPTWARLVSLRQTAVDYGRRVMKANNIGIAEVPAIVGAEVTTAARLLGFRLRAAQRWRARLRDALCGTLRLRGQLPLFRFEVLSQEYPHLNVSLKEGKVASELAKDARMWVREATELFGRITRSGKAATIAEYLHYEDAAALGPEGNGRDFDAKSEPLPPPPPPPPPPPQAPIAVEEGVVETSSRKRGAGASSSSAAAATVPAQSGSKKRRITAEKDQEVPVVAVTPVLPVSSAVIPTAPVTAAPIVPTPAPPSAPLSSHPVSNLMLSRHAAMLVAVEKAPPVPIEEIWSTLKTAEAFPIGLDPLLADLTSRRDRAIELARSIREHFPYYAAHPRNSWGYRLVQGSGVSRDLLGSQIPMSVLDSSTGNSESADGDIEMGDGGNTHGAKDSALGEKGTGTGSLADGSTPYTTYASYPSESNFGSFHTIINGSARRPRIPLSHLEALSRDVRESGVAFAEGELVKAIQMEALSWIAKSLEAVSFKHRAPLQELKDLLNDADEIPVDLSERVVVLRMEVDRVKKWVELVRGVMPGRGTASRTRKSGGVGSGTVETSGTKTGTAVFLQLSNAIAQAHNGTIAAQADDAVEAEVLINSTQRWIEEVRASLDRSRPVRILLDHEKSELMPSSGHSAASSFSSSSSSSSATTTIVTAASDFKQAGGETPESLLTSDGELSIEGLTALVKQADDIPILTDEYELLQAELAARKWILKAQKVLSQPTGARIDLLKSLVEEIREIRNKVPQAGMPSIHSSRTDEEEILRNAIRTGEDWIQRSKRALTAISQGQRRVDVTYIRELISEAATIPIVNLSSNTKPLENTVSSLDRWYSLAEPIISRLKARKQIVSKYKGGVNNLKNIQSMFSELATLPPLSSASVSSLAAEANSLIAIPTGENVLQAALSDLNAWNSSVHSLLYSSNKDSRLTMASARELIQNMFELGLEVEKSKVDGVIVEYGRVRSWQVKVRKLLSSVSSLSPLYTVAPEVLNEESQFDIFLQQAASTLTPIGISSMALDGESEEQGSALTLSMKPEDSIIASISDAGSFVDQPEKITLLLEELLESAKGLQISTKEESLMSLHRRLISWSIEAKQFTDSIALVKKTLLGRMVHNAKIASARSSLEPDGDGGVRGDIVLDLLEDPLPNINPLTIPVVSDINEITWEALLSQRVSGVAAGVAGAYWEGIKSNDQNDDNAVPKPSRLLYSVLKRLILEGATLGLRITTNENSDVMADVEDENVDDDDPPVPASASSSSSSDMQVTRGSSSMDVDVDAKETAVSAAPDASLDSANAAPVSRKKAGRQLKRESKRQVSLQSSGELADEAAAGIAAEKTKKSEAQMVTAEIHRMAIDDMSFMNSTSHEISSLTNMCTDLYRLLFSEKKKADKCAKYLRAQLATTAPPFQSTLPLPSALLLCAAGLKCTIELDDLAVLFKGFEQSRSVLLKSLPVSPPSTLNFQNEKTPAIFEDLPSCGPTRPRYGPQHKLTIQDRTTVLRIEKTPDGQDMVAGIGMFDRPVKPKKASGIWPVTVNPPTGAGEAPSSIQPFDAELAADTTSASAVDMDTPSTFSEVTSSSPTKVKRPNVAEVEAFVHDRSQKLIIAVPQLKALRFELRVAKRWFEEAKKLVAGGAVDHSSERGREKINEVVDASEFVWLDVSKPLASLAKIEVSSCSCRDTKSTMMIRCNDCSQISHLDCSGILDTGLYFSAGVAWKDRISKVKTPELDSVTPEIVRNYLCTLCVVKKALARVVKESFTAVMNIKLQVDMQISGGHAVADKNESSTSLQRAYRTAEALNTPHLESGEGFKLFPFLDKPTLEWVEHVCNVLDPETDQQSETFRSLQNVRSLLRNTLTGSTRSDSIAASSSSSSVVSLDLISKHPSLHVLLLFLKIFFLQMITKSVFSGSKDADRRYPSLSDLRALHVCVIEAMLRDPSPAILACVPNFKSEAKELQKKLSVLTWRGGAWREAAQKLLTSEGQCVELDGASQPGSKDSH
jgi:hypothetical protein